MNSNLYRIHGDNLAALRSLLPEFEGKINCIYIDTPYNTDKEGEDSSHHNKWLCMMYPRLKLLHRLLAKNGVISISIDDK